MVASRETFPLLAELLAEQQRLDTPVARLASAYDQLAPGATSLAPQLIPLTTPLPGEQYAFEVDLDSCTGCKSCVAACHSLNGLDENETWRDVGLLVSTERRHPFTQTITTACHHCADPACLNGCPVLAYEKDPVTGIVRHLDDQCIGCSYCILKCPYDVPKFSTRLGIVRKCDMCHDRLAHGEAPACVQACPTSAIRIVTVGIEDRKPETEYRKKESIVGPKRSGIRSPVSGFLSAAPDPSYTQPTTRYISRRPLPPNVIAADAGTLRAQPPHWPLIALTTLMPLAIGCGVVDKLLRPPSPALALLSWIAGASALALSVLHLGQPLRAWRIFLGLRRSWLSREAIAFGAWFPLATMYLVGRLGGVSFAHRWPQAALAAASATMGIAGLFCSVMIYVDTRREFWRFAQTAPRFFGSAVVLGLAMTYAFTLTGPVALALGVAMLLKLSFEIRALRPLQAADRDDPPPSARLKTARLLSDSLRPILGLRTVCALVGGVLLPFCIAAGAATQSTVWVAAALVLAGEIAERYLFFRAVDAPKMPGQPAGMTAHRAA